MRLGIADPAVDVARVRAVRKAIGPHVRLMADANQGLIRKPGDPAWPGAGGIRPDLVRRAAAGLGSRRACARRGRARHADRQRRNRIHPLRLPAHAGIALRRRPDARSAACRRRQRIHASRSHGGEPRHSGVEPSLPGDEHPGARRARERELPRIHALVFRSLPRDDSSSTTAMRWCRNDRASASRSITDYIDAPRAGVDAPAIDYDSQTLREKLQ